MRRFVLGLVVMLGLVCGVARDVRAHALNAFDTAFANDLATVMNDEIALGHFVLGSAQQTSVRTFAQYIMIDADTFKQQLLQLGRQHGQSISSFLDGTGRYYMAVLKNAAPNQVDCLFVSSQVQLNERAMDLVKTSLARLDDGELGNVVQRLLPALQYHRDYARQVFDALPVQCWAV